MSVVLCTCKTEEKIRDEYEKVYLICRQNIALTNKQMNLDFRIEKKGEKLDNLFYISLSVCLHAYIFQLEGLINLCIWIASSCCFFPFSLNLYGKQNRKWKEKRVFNLWNKRRNVQQNLMCLRRSSETVAMIEHNFHIEALRWGQQSNQTHKIHSE